RPGAPVRLRPGLPAPLPHTRLDRSRPPPVRRDGLVRRSRTDLGDGPTAGSAAGSALRLAGARVELAGERRGIAAARKGRQGRPRTGDLPCRAADSCRRTSFLQLLDLLLEALHLVLELAELVLLVLQLIFEFLAFLGVGVGFLLERQQPGLGVEHLLVLVGLL